jgi:hypothetical protein
MVFLSYDQAVGADVDHTLISTLIELLITLCTVCISIDDHQYLQH